jgi:acetolactate synthase I/II/III large subunit
MHGGKLVAKTFKAAGVECVFTLSGGHIMPIYDGCQDEGIDIIDVRHEQAAAHAADAWSRVRPGSIGVALVTAGPGVTDAVTGVANAWRANSPMLVIGGQGPFANRGKGSLQEMDHVALMKPITKWADACYETERIPEYIELAMRHAVSGIPGPAFLELPMDILMGEARWEVDIPNIQTQPPAISPAPEPVGAAIELLAKAKRPMMMVGTSVKWSQAADALTGFLDKTRIPAYANGMGRGMLPRDSERLFNRTRRQAMEQCDVILLAGAVLDFRLGFGQSIPKEAKIIQLEMDNTLIGQNRSTDVALVGNLSCTLDALSAAVDAGTKTLDFSAYAAELRAEEDAKMAAAAQDAANDQVPIHASRLCREIADFVNDDMIIVGDGGDIVAKTAKVLPIPKNGIWMDPGPLGTLGVGMPFALAAQQAHPDKRVLIVYGDGSFGLNGFEYDTAIRFNFPIVGIIGNDAAWGQMMRPQIAFYPEKAPVATQLNYTRYDKVVEAMGGHGEYVTEPDQIRPALERAFASGKAACINVEIERDLSFGGGIYV